MEGELHNPEFWVAIGFVLFVLACWKPFGIFGFIGQALDKRGEQIAKELAEASRLRKEAEAMLASYQEKQRESLAEAERILQQTRNDAEQFARNAEAELTRSLDKRRALSLVKIEQAEKQAVQDVRQRVIDMATEAARLVISQSLSAEQDKALIASAADSLGGKLH